MDRLEPAKAAFLFVFCAFTVLATGLTGQFQLSSKKNKIWKWAWVAGGLWLLDILLVPCRVIQTVPDPYRNDQVRQSAQRAKEMTGEGRLASLKEAGKFYPEGDGTLAGSFEATARELVPNTNVVWGLNSARGYLTMYTDGFQNLNRYLQSGYPYDGRILDAAGVDLIIYSRALPAFKYNLNEPHGPSVWTKNAGAMAGAWKVETVREFPDRASVFDALLDPKAFLEETVYTEKHPMEKRYVFGAGQPVPFGIRPFLLGTIEGKGLRMVPKRDDPGGDPGPHPARRNLPSWPTREGFWFSTKVSRPAGTLGWMESRKPFSGRMVFSWRLPWMRRGNIKLNSDTNQSHSAWGFL